MQDTIDRLYEHAYDIFFIPVLQCVVTTTHTITKVIKCNKILNDMFTVDKVILIPIQSKTDVFSKKSSLRVKVISKSPKMTLALMIH